MLSKLLPSAAAILLAAGSSMAMAGESNQRTYGFLDSSGAFHPQIAQSPQLAGTQATTVNTGSIVLNLTITIASDTAHLARTNPVRCMLTASAMGYSPPEAIIESDQISATISGTTATCKLVIPYSWTLLNKASDTVALQYSVQAIDQYGNGRTHTFMLPTIAVPANAATTTYTRTARI